MNRTDSEYQALETMCALACAAMAIGFIFKIRAGFQLAFLFLLSALIAPKISGVIAKGWLAFAHTLGRINSNVVLSLLFYMLLVPIAFMYRTFSRDFPGICNSKKSLWRIRQ